MDIQTAPPQVPNQNTQTPTPAPMTPPVTQPPMHPHHRSPVVPALIGGVVVLLLVVAANATGIWPFSKSDTAMVSPSPSASPTPSLSVSPTALDLNEIFGLAQKAAGTKVYYSDKLGIGFTYYSSYNPPSADPYTTKIVETGNIIHLQILREGKLQVEDTLEVFSKDPTTTLVQAVTSKFLTGYDPKNCWAISIAGRQGPVKPTTGSPGLANYIAAQITFPPTNDLEELIRAQAKCVQGDYTRTNAAGHYFGMNTDIPGKFFFVRQGQDIAADDGIPDDQGAWDRSIRVLK